MPNKRNSANNQLTPGICRDYERRCREWDMRGSAIQESAIPMHLLRSKRGRKPGATNNKNVRVMQDFETTNN